VVFALVLFATPASETSVATAQSTRTVSIEIIRGRHHDILANGLDDFVYQGRGIYEIHQLSRPPRLRVTGVGLGESTLLLRFSDGRQTQYRIKVVAN